MYSGLEGGEMVCMSSDIEGDDVDFDDDLINLDLDSDWEGEDGDVQISEHNNSESDQEEIDKSPPAKKGENSSMSLPPECLKLCVRKMLVK